MANMVSTKSGILVDRDRFLDVCPDLHLRAEAEDAFFRYYYSQTPDARLNLVLEDRPIPARHS